MSVFGSKSKDSWDVSVERKMPFAFNFLAYTTWKVDVIRDGNLIESSVDHNMVVNEGLNDILEVYFHSGTQKTAWYILIYETNTTPGAGTTYATPVWTESTAYNEATRPACTFAAASGQTISNSGNVASFTMNASKTIYGGAIVAGGSAATTKGDAAGGGKMYAATLFSAAKSVVASDIIRITVTITSAST